MNLPQQPNDKRQQAIEAVAAMGTNLLGPPDRQKHSATEAVAPADSNPTTIARMRAKLHTAEAPRAVSNA